MGQILKADEQQKRKLKILCFLPAVCFGLCLIYYIILLSPLLHGQPQPKSAVGITEMHYTTLFIILAISATISAVTLIYCAIHLIRLKTLNAQTKMEWALVLVTFVPISFILFWMMQVRKESADTPLYSGII